MHDSNIAIKSNINKMKEKQREKKSDKKKKISNFENN